VPGDSRKYPRLDDLSAQLSSNEMTRTEGIEVTDVVRAISSAVVALADTLNALGLRVALARDASDAGGGSDPSYHNRLARLTESAAGQVRGIQQLLATIDETSVVDRPRLIKPTGGSRS
jgi:hypothetical protein